MSRWRSPPSCLCLRPLKKQFCPRFSRTASISRYCEPGVTCSPNGSQVSLETSAQKDPLFGGPGAHSALFVPSSNPAGCLKLGRKGSAQLLCSSFDATRRLRWQRVASLTTLTVVLASPSWVSHCSGLGFGQWRNVSFWRRNPKHVLIVSWKRRKRQAPASWPVKYRLGKELLDMAFGVLMCSHACNCMLVDVDVSMWGSPWIAQWLGWLR